MDLLNLIGQKVESQGHRATRSRTSQTFKVNGIAERTRKNLAIMKFYSVKKQKKSRLLNNSKNVRQEALLIMPACHTNVPGLLNPMNDDECINSRTWDVSFRNRHSRRRS